MFFNFLFFSENGPLFLEQIFKLFNYSSAQIFHQNGEERIIDQFQSTKYCCEPLVSKIVGVPKTLTS